MVPDCFGSSCSEKLGQAQPLVSRPFLATRPRFRYNVTGLIQSLPQACSGSSGFMFNLAYASPVLFCSVFPTYHLFLFCFSLAYTARNWACSTSSFSPKDLTKQMLINKKPCELTLSEIFLSFWIGMGNVGGGIPFPL